MRAERKIYDVLMRATKEGTVPLGYYDPATCRWATPEGNATLRP